MRAGANDGVHFSRFPAPPRRAHFSLRASAANYDRAHKTSRFADCYSANQDRDPDSSCLRLLGCCKSCLGEQFTAPPQRDTKTHADAWHGTPCLPQLSFLDGLNLYELLVEQKIVENLQRPRDEERHIDPGSPCKHEPDEQRAEGRARGARNSRKSARGRSLFDRDDGHRIGLSGGNIHLADAEAEEKHRHGQREIGHQRHEDEKNVRRKMRDHHGADEPDPRRKARSKKSGDSRKDVCPEENRAKRSWFHAKAQIKPIRNETLQNESPRKGIQSKEP